MRSDRQHGSLSFVIDPYEYAQLKPRLGAKVERVLIDPHGYDKSLTCVKSESFYRDKTRTCSSYHSLIVELVK